MVPTSGSIFTPDQLMTDLWTWKMFKQTDVWKSFKKKIVKITFNCFSVNKCDNLKLIVFFFMLNNNKTSLFNTYKK